jgi:hypothetical protein
MADAPNAVRDPQARIDELLKANNAEVERRRAAEKRYDDLADGFWRIVDGAKLRGALPSNELDTLQRIVRRLEDRDLQFRWIRPELFLGRRCRITERSAYFDEWKRTPLWFAGMTMDDRTGFANMWVSTQWTPESLGDLTDGWRPEDIEILPPDYPDNPAASNERPDEIQIGDTRYVPEGALDAEKMANAQMFEGLWNIRLIASRAKPDAPVGGDIDQIFEIANALAPDAPAQTEGGTT